MHIYTLTVLHIKVAYGVCKLYHGDFHCLSLRNLIIFSFKDLYDIFGNIQGGSKKEEGSGKRNDGEL